MCRRVIRLTLVLASGDNAPPAQRPKRCRDDRVACFSCLVVAVQHDPVASLPKIVSAHGVGEESRVMPYAPARVKDRKPGFMGRVEPSRRDESQLSRRRFISVFPIDVEELADGWRRVCR